MILWDHMVSNTELRGGGDSVVSNKVQKKKKKKKKKQEIEDVFLSRINRFSERKFKGKKTVRYN